MRRLPLAARLQESTQPLPDDPTALREARERLATLVEAKLTDDGLKGQIPLFVRGESAQSDYKCESCMHRMERAGLGDGTACAIIEGGISLSRGTCAFWSRGIATAHAHEARMSKAEGGYVEVPAGTRVQCGTCTRFDGPGSFCRLWEGEVGAGDCCVSYRPKTPGGS